MSDGTTLQAVISVQIVSYYLLVIIQSHLKKRPLALGHDQCMHEGPEPADQGCSEDAVCGF